MAAVASVLTKGAPQKAKLPKQKTQRHFCVGWRLERWGAPGHAGRPTCHLGTLDKQVRPRIGGAPRGWSSNAVFGLAGLAPFLKIVFRRNQDVPTDRERNQHVASVACMIKHLKQELGSHRCTPAGRRSARLLDKLRQDYDQLAIHPAFNVRRIVRNQPDIPHHRPALGNKARALDIEVFDQRHRIPGR